MNRAFRYPARALAAEYARAALGAALFLGALAWLEPAPVVGGFLTAGAALFLVYFARTVCRQLTRIELDEAGIRASGPLGAAIRWADLRSLRLDYYSTRRDQEEGWMQLRLRDARQTLRIDSGLAGFAQLARAAAARVVLDNWLAASPELAGGSLIDEGRGVIWRKVARREPGKLSRYLNAGASRVYAPLRVPGLDGLFPARSIDFEDRPYHLGWMLYAWSPRLGDTTGRTRADAVE